MVEAIARAAAEANRYPDPHATLLRRRIAERYETDPARVAVGNGSCEILLAAAEALCEPGAEIVYAWPSFSIYPYLAALSGAREIRVPLADGDVHDLDAMLTEITAATQLADRLQPQQPDRHPPPGRRIGAFLERVPDHVTVILDEAYVEFQTERRPRRDARPAVATSRTWSSAHVQQGLRAGRAAGRLRARLGRVPRRGRRRAPAVQRQRARPGGRGRGDPAPRRRRSAASSGRSSSASGSRRSCASSASRRRDRRPTSPGSPSATRDEAEVVEALGRRGRDRPRRATPLGGPGHIRVTYGTRAENERFLDALGEVL